MDVTGAVVVTPGDLTGPERKAVTMLVEEVQKRSQVRWNEVHEWPEGAEAVIAVGPGALLKTFSALGDQAAFGEAPEGYRLRTGRGRVVVAGNDARGVLFGVGRLLRELRMSKRSVLVPEGLDIVTAPKYPLRGHQLGYRPKVNSYDGWTVPMWEQYIRDLAVFGTNAIELLPPHTDDDADSPHFVMPQMDMMVEMSRIADEYGLDVWIWNPAMGVTPDDPRTFDAALKEWGDVFEKLPRIDAILVPGGDPGSLAPDALLKLLERGVEVLHRTHPKAQMWVSPQGFNEERLTAFLDTLTKEQPTWLTGIVFGPQNRCTLPELRKAVPKQYPIRHYPDITHSVQCQLPVPEWDPAYGFTEQREVINPRPTNFAGIIRQYDEYTIGFISYSEGCNDDVNKIVWSGLGWDPDTPVLDVLRDYARYFIGLKYEDSFAQGILALERNWRGPLLTNRGVFTTLEQFQDMEGHASPQDLLNWRFQQALYRAYYDAYVARRLAYETELEQQAMDVLRLTPKPGQFIAPRMTTLTALDEAEHILDRSETAPVAQDLRARVFELAEALYQSIRMQLSVSRYQAIGIDRGANLDLIDIPLNNGPWLKQRFAEMRGMDEPGRREQIAEIVNWADPGPGGFYDNLGTLTQRPHLVREPDWTVDPEFRQAPLLGTEYMLNRRNSWNAYTETRYDSPLRLRYEGLDPRGHYKVRVVYSGDTTRVKMRLVANGQYEIHPYIARVESREEGFHPMEFSIPRAATSGGELTLAWTQEPGRGGNGRGCQVAEVWLLKESTQQ